MSHIVSIATKVHDHVSIEATCRRLGLEMPRQGTAKVFDTEVTGLLLQLPGWSYPAVIDVLSGTIKYDTYEGAWGDQKHLHGFLQAYAVERAKLEARKKGHTVSEQTLSDGSIKLSIQVG
jgi:hypothetical protein